MGRCFLSFIRKIGGMSRFLKQKDDLSLKYDDLFFIITINGL